jgi:dihydrofolate synthase/folylpolyglutamate synthase
MSEEYQQTLDWLYALESARGMDFKLERVALALQRFGDPHRRFPSIHIAGTNGKGSVAAMLHAVLSHAGYRVGLYTSPHLVRFTERIRVGNEEIPPEQIVELTRRIRALATASGIELTFFEFVTVLAFLHFAEAGIDVGVIEVGLGGRLDATNVIEPLASVITTIGLDHIQYLGDSIESIAAEKGGIIKPGRPVIVGEVGETAAAVLSRIAEERKSPLFRAGRDYVISKEIKPSFRGLGWALEDLEIGLLGRYQRENAGTALATLALLRDHFSLSEEEIRLGLASVCWPGRLEIVSHKPTLILDCAHNVEGIAVLVRELQTLDPRGSVHAVFAVMRDKDWRGMAARLAPVCASVTVTEVLPPRGESCAVVADAFRSFCPVHCEPDPVRALQDTCVRASASDWILVTGSLFLIGAVYPTCSQPGAFVLLGQDAPQLP